MTFDEVVQALGTGADTIAKIRQPCAGHDDVSLDEAVVRALASKDARIAELLARANGSSATTPGGGGTVITSGAFAGQSTPDAFWKPEPLFEDNFRSLFPKVHS